MTKGRIILSAAALVATVASSLAFKTAHKGGTQLWTKQTGTCRTVNCYTTASGGGGCNITVSVYTTSACSTKYTGSKTTTL